MKPIIAKTANEAYLKMCKNLIKASEVGDTREIIGQLITIQDITDNIVTARDISIPYLCGELLWYFLGRNDLEFMSKFSSMWEKLSDDGKTLNSSYGHIIFTKHGFDQLQTIIDLLKIAPNTRRAVININVPNAHVIDTKDEPCTIALQFYIRNNALNLIVMMRSNDIWFGFPYDITFFTELQKYVALELGISFGTYTHFATSLHVYNRDYEKIKALAANPKTIKSYMHLDVIELIKYKKLIERCIERSITPKNDVVVAFTNLGILKY